MERLIRVIGDSYTGGVGSVIDPEGTSYTGIIFQQDKEVLAKELNFIVQLSNYERASLFRKIFPSGVLGRLSKVREGTELNSFQFEPQDFLIDGYLVTVRGNESNVQVTLGNPPSSGEREDFVFLEVWFEEVSAGLVGDGTSGVVYKYGGVSNNQLSSDILEPALGHETTRRVQLRWRVRIKEGVDFSISKYGFGASVINPIGGNQSEVSNYIFSFCSAGLYRAGDGSLESANLLKTVDGYVYAVPLFRVRRVANDFSISLSDITDLRQRVYIFNETIEDDVLQIRIPDDVESLEDALKIIKDYKIPSGGVVKIKIGRGVWDFNHSLLLEHIQASQIEIEGEEGINLSFDGVEDIEGSSGGWQITLHSTSNLSSDLVGGYLLINDDNATQVLNGAWYVNSINLEDSTLTIVCNYQYSSLPSFSVSNFSGKVYKTILRFTDSDGLIIKSPFKKVSNVVLEGLGMFTGSGIKVISSEKVYCENVAVVRFNNGFEVLSGFLEGVNVIASGNIKIGFIVSDGAKAIIDNSVASCNGWGGYKASNYSYIKASESCVFGNFMDGVECYDFRAEGMSFIDAEGYIEDVYTPSFSPLVNEIGNRNSYIGG